MIDVEAIAKTLAQVRGSRATRAAQKFLTGLWGIDPASMLRGDGFGEHGKDPKFEPHPDKTHRMVFRRDFKDVTELAVYVSHPTPWGAPDIDQEQKFRYKYMSRSSRKESAYRWDESWSGDKDFPSAVERLMFGWPEAVAHIRDLSGHINRSLAEKIPLVKPRYDVDGASIDIGTFLEGEPEYMVSMDRRPSVVNAVDVVMNVCASAGVNSDTIRARGAVAAGLIFALDRLGIPTSLTVASANDGYKNTTMLTTVKVKDEGEPLDLSRVAYAVCSPGMLRRIMFAVWENETEDTRRMYDIPGGGYGTVADMPLSERGDVYFSGSHYGDHQWRTPEGAVDWVLAELRRLGVLNGDEQEAGR